ncbi:hypothetical protein Aperf_G00000122067 [Anoplocephala perfoliata]
MDKSKIINDLWAARIQLVFVCVIVGVSEIVKVGFPYTPFLGLAVTDDAALKSSGAEIPLLTVLSMDTDNYFLDPDDFENGKADIGVFLTIPFARGICSELSRIRCLLRSKCNGNNPLFACSADLWAARIQLVFVCVIVGVSEIVKVGFPYTPFLGLAVTDDAALKSSGAEIPLLTVLSMDTDNYFLDPDDFENGKADIGVFLTIPFARGICSELSRIRCLLRSKCNGNNPLFACSAGIHKPSDKHRWINNENSTHSSLCFEPMEIQAIERLGKTVHYT